MVIPTDTPGSASARTASPIPADLPDLPPWDWEEDRRKAERLAMLFTKVDDEHRKGRLPHFHKELDDPVGP